MNVCSSSGSSILLPTNAIVLCKGAGRSFKLTIDDACGKLLPTSGLTLVLTVKACLDDLFPVIVKSSKFPSQISFPGAAGQAIIHFVPADTTNLSLGDYLYDVWLKVPGNEPSCIIEPSLFRVGRRVTVWG